MSYVLYCDGACSGNPGPGGYAWRLEGSEMEPLEGTGGELSTTKIRMEMMALLKGLEAAPITAKGQITVVSVNQHVINGNTTWRKGWENREMYSSNGEPVANPELWKQIWQLADSLQATFEWVKATHCEMGNLRVNDLAVQARMKQQAAKPPRSSLAPKLSMTAPVHAAPPLALTFNRGALPDADDGSLALVLLNPEAMQRLGLEYYGQPVVVSRWSGKLKTTLNAHRLSYEDVTGWLLLKS